MTRQTDRSRFEATLQRPADPGEEGEWAFLVLPRSVSEALPRRGRTTVEGSLDGHAFQATLEPDGRLSHWLRVDEALLKASRARVGDTVCLEIAPVEREPEPEPPSDLRAALALAPEAAAVWDATTTIARVDWIHWIESAKQSKTRKRRIENACDMLASGQKRVCCFDPSGFYSKGLAAPKAADPPRRSRITGV